MKTKALHAHALLILGLIGLSTQSISTAIPKNVKILAPEIYKANKDTTYQIQKTYAREDNQYTQGFVYIKDGNKILQSTGEYGKSQINYLQLDEVKETATVTKLRKLRSNDFGEGCDIIYNNIYQLTWESRKIFVYNKELKPLATVPLPLGIAEGWGLTHSEKTTQTDSGEKFTTTTAYVTDGSNILFHCKVDPVSHKFTIVKKVPVFVVTRHGHKQSLDSLNELQFIDGYVWSNVYLSNHIARINPLTGEAILFDMSALRAIANRETRKRFKRDLDYEECLNGIALLRRENGVLELLLTGKDWPVIFQVRMTGKQMLASAGGLNSAGQRVEGLMTE